MKTAATHFSTWFLEHKAKLKMLPQLNVKEQKQYTHWLDWHLQFYCPGIEYILIFPKHKNKKTKLIFSAKGNQELFKTAIELEKTARNLWDWKFTAIIQPRDDHDDIEGRDLPYIFQDITLKTNELKFIPLKYDGKKKIDIVVYMKNFTIYSHNKNLPLLINIMVHDLLGEKLMCENSNFVQLPQMPEQDDDLIYLYDLQFYIDFINIIKT